MLNMLYNKLLKLYAKYVTQQSTIEIANYVTQKNYWSYKYVIQQTTIVILWILYTKKFYSYMLNISYNTLL